MAGSCHSLLIFSVCTGAAVTVLSMLHRGAGAHPNATCWQRTRCAMSVRRFMQQSGVGRHGGGQRLGTAVQENR